jgi:hypothetical protein
MRSPRLILLWLVIIALSAWVTCAGVPVAGFVGGFSAAPPLCLSSSDFDGPGNGLFWARARQDGVEAQDEADSADDDEENPESSYGNPSTLLSTDCPGVLATFPRPACGIFRDLTRSPLLRC